MSLANLPKEWTFESNDVALNFDAHVREQLPWYDLACGAVAHIARHYIRPGSVVYDVGASTGHIGKLLRDVIDARHAQLVAIESSHEMAKFYQGGGALLIRNALDVDYKAHSCSICNLVLQFLSVGERKTLIDTLRSKLEPGGALIVVDKFEAVQGYQATVLARLTLAGKVAQGASANDIIAKELSLGGVQRPLSLELMYGANEFFRFGEFAGFVFDAS